MSIRSFRKAVVGAALIGAAGGALAATAIGSGPGNAGRTMASEVQTLVEDEEPLTGEALAQATAAAKAAVPDGTIERVETDADGAAYRPQPHLRLSPRPRAGGRIP